jgi:ABC-type polysaccharide transport system permease subunit
MELAKNVALVLQALSVTILGLNFAGVKPDSLPRILQPLFLIPWYLYVVLFVGLLAVFITQKEKIRQIGSTPPAPRYYRRSMR